MPRWHRLNDVGRHAPILVLVTGFVTAIHGQASQERSADRPTVDFVALSADGRTVAGLTPSDVSIRIDGRPRVIRSLQLITTADAPSGTSGSGVPPPYGSSRASGAGRTVVFVVDDDSLRAGHEGRLREGARGLLAGLTSRDRVSFVTMPYGGVKVPLTDDHARVERALLMLVGQAPQGETGSEMACRTRRVLESLVGLLGTYADRDEPVTVLFFSTSLAGPRRDAPIMMAPGMCELTKDHFQQVADAAARARANFYVIQPDDEPQFAGARGANITGAGFAGSDNPLEGLENLAGVTSASRLHLATTAAALSRVVDETAAYYVASLEPQPSDRNGRLHQLEVKVARPGVTVRARPAIEFAKEMRRGAPAARANAREMLRVAGGFSDVPIRATGYVSRGDGDGRLKVVIVAEPIHQTARLASAAAALVDQAGLIVAQWTATDMDASPLMGAMVVPPGTYRLRVAATDRAGGGGTADETIVAQLTPAGPLSLSSLVLGLSRDGAFLPTLEFGSEPVAIASFEIHGGAAGQPLVSALDVARTLDGFAIITGRLTLERAGDGRYVATGAIPIGALPPGDYIVRATVGLEGQIAGAVTRTLRKAVR